MKRSLTGLIFFTPDSRFILSHRFIKFLPDKITVCPPFYPPYLPLLRNGRHSPSHQKKECGSRQENLYLLLSHFSNFLSVTLSEYIIGEIYTELSRTYPPLRLFTFQREIHIFSTQIIFIVLEVRISQANIQIMLLIKSC